MENVTRTEFNDLKMLIDRHLVEAGEGFSRLSKVEAELMGDTETGRPSLRNELTSQMNTIRRIGITILVALVVGIVSNWLGIGVHSVHADPQEQRK